VQFANSSNLTYTAMMKMLLLSLLATQYSNCVWSSLSLLTWIHIVSGVVCIVCPLHPGSNFLECSLYTISVVFCILFPTIILITQTISVFWSIWPFSLWQFFCSICLTCSGHKSIFFVNLGIFYVLLLFPLFRPAAAASRFQFFLSI